MRLKILSYRIRDLEPNLTNYFKTQKSTTPAFDQTIKASFVFGKKKYSFPFDFKLIELFDVLEEFEIDREELLTHSDEEIRKLGLIENKLQLSDYIRNTIREQHVKMITKEKQGCNEQDPWEIDTWGIGESRSWFKPILPSKWQNFTNTNKIVDFYQDNP